jgi:CHAD domain-containing protein
LVTAVLQASGYTESIKQKGSKKDRRMSYRFLEGETVPDGVRRIALEQIDKALELTTAGSQAGKNLDEAIHDTRVCCKKVRGLLRLVRFELDDETFKTENVYYRDANRSLSSVRDTAAMVETLDKLIEGFAGQLAEAAFQTMRKSLARSTKNAQVDKEKALAEVKKTLTEARQRVEQWPLEKNDFSALGRGLKRIYKQGRLCFATAFDQQSVESFHEWRKQVKYLWYHMRLLQPLWPALLQQLADEIKVLSDYLNADHDLAMLREWVLEQPRKADDLTEIETLVALIDQRRGELQVLAQLLGKRLYVEQPEVFRNRFYEYWRAWRAEQRIDPIAVS